MWFDAKAALAEIHVSTATKAEPTSSQAYQTGKRVAHVARVAPSQTCPTIAEAAPALSTGFRISGSGPVPDVYVAAWAKFRSAPPISAIEDEWRLAISGGYRFLADWGDLAAQVDWPDLDLFEWCTDRASGLIWQLRGSDVLELTSHTAVISAGPAQSGGWFTRPRVSPISYPHCRIQHVHQK